MPIYDVTSVALHRQTGTLVAGPRTERVNTDTNELFVDCRDELDVHDQYEEFWHALREHCGCGCADQMIRVLSVVRVV